MMNLPEEKIVCFDGVCGICNGYIDFLIKRDKERVLRYAPLQNEKIKRKLEGFGQSTDKLETIFFISGNKVFLRSTAVLEILLAIRWMPWLVEIMYLFPVTIRDVVYNLVAKNRYSIIPKRDTCRIPTKEERDLFFD